MTKSTICPTCGLQPAPLTQIDTVCERIQQHLGALMLAGPLTKRQAQEYEFLSTAFRGLRELFQKMQDEGPRS